jgi:hypothetical protein
MNREILLENKRAELYEAIQAWATENIRLKPDEVVVFHLGIAKMSSVRALGESGLVAFGRLRLEDYFTHARINAAGIEGKLASRVRNIMTTMADTTDTKTVSDLVMRGLRNLIKARNAGRETVDAVKRILNRDGISLI